jgi:hypothetical protein
VEHLRRVRRGLFPGRSPDVVFVPRAPNFFGGFSATTHSGPWNYVQRVPLVFYGPGYFRARGALELAREVTLADVAPTLAELLGAPWPARRAGRVLNEVLLPSERRARPPALLLTVVWDGGGWNVLERWPRAWPGLAEMMKSGTSVTNATVGSSPTVTPAVHATIGTGAFPRETGIVDIPLRAGGEIVPYSFPGADPSYLRLASVADIYDRSVNNAAEVGMLAYQAFHLGMMGRGAQIPGGDRDLGIIVSEERGADATDPGHFWTNNSFYDVPPYLEAITGFEGYLDTVDRADGRLDRAWRGHIDLTDPTHVRHSPVWVLFQTKVIETLLAREGFGNDAIPDLFFTNYKQIDDVGHNWNMLNPEMREVLQYSDASLGALTHWLDEHVGRRRWAMVVTADHGQAPDPAAVGAWPIGIGPLKADVASHFGVEPGDLFAEERPVGFWLERGAPVTPGEIADYLMGYRLRDNASSADAVPDQYRSRLDERLFAAAWPSRAMERVWACALRRAG